MNLLYAYRGWILGVLAVAMLVVPGAPVSSDWLCETLPMSAACLVVFALLRVCARRTIGEHTRGFAHDADRLVTEGVYARIRHPLYLSNGGIGYAFIVLHFGYQLVALAFVVALFAFEFLLSRLEDRFLERRFGDDWRSWAAVTPAFFPHVTGGTWRGPEGAKGARGFVAAFKADMSTWFWLAVAIALIMGRKFVG